MSVFIYRYTYRCTHTYKAVNMFRERKKSFCSKLNYHYSVPLELYEKGFMIKINVISKKNKCNFIWSVTWNVLTREPLCPCGCKAATCCLPRSPLRILRNDFSPSPFLMVTHPVSFSNDVVTVSLLLSLTVPLVCKMRHYNCLYFKNIQTCVYMFCVSNCV